MNQPGFFPQSRANAGASPALSPTGATVPTTLLPPSRTFGPLTFDAVVSEHHTAESTITTQPLEMGGSVADHAYDLPRILKLQAIVSNVFFGNPAGDLFSQNTAGSRAKNAWAMLCQLKAAHTPLTVVTGLDVYTSMVIKSLSAPQDVTSAGRLLVDIEMQDVVFVSTQNVVMSGGMSGGAVVNAGNVPGTPVATPKPQYTSGLSMLTGWGH